MAIVPYPLYSSDLAPYDFPLFPKLKMKLKGLDSIKEMSATVLLKHDKKDGITVHIPKKIIL
jgi:hypothetical protein